MKYNVIVIGGGVGGYPAAIQLARAGYKVALVEEHLIGGECTNYGCVPSKAMYSIAEAINNLRKINADIHFNWKDVVKWTKEVVNSTRENLEYLLENYGVTIYKGKALFKNDKVIVNNLELKYDKLVLALGTNPRPLPGIDFDEKLVISNRNVFYLDEKPESMLIIGGGVIGVELANIFASMGTQVILVEALEHILPFLDRDVAIALKRYLVDKGVVVYEKTTARTIDRQNNGVTVKLSNEKTYSVSNVLVSIGRVPRTTGVGLRNIDVKTDDKGFIIVNNRYQTSNPRIYAVGDVIGGPLLAHKAIIESLLVAEEIRGSEINRLDYRLVPVTIFSGLEISYIGYIEKELQSNGIRYQKYKLPISSLPVVKIKDSKYSFVKILVDRDNPVRVYGIQIVAPRASEAIATAIPIILGDYTLRRIAKTPIPHLTIAEILRDLAEYVLGEPIHYLIKK
ncbi:MAG: NAD(P)/FAD-dependent oxidoreductase [Thermoprotei archaeon]